VTNLSALGRAEAETFLARSTGRVCVTYVPAPVGGAASREDLAQAPGTRRGFLAVRLARLAALCLGLLTLLPGCRPADARPDDGGDPGVDPRVDPEDVQGRIVGKLRADPTCVVDDERMIMGEMVVSDPRDPLPGVQPAGE
jgi:hypothetical protein